MNMRNISLVFFLTLSSVVAAMQEQGAQGSNDPKDRTDAALRHAIAVQEKELAHNEAQLGRLKNQMKVLLGSHSLEEVFQAIDQKARQSSEERFREKQQKLSAQIKYLTRHIDNIAERYVASLINGNELRATLYLSGQRKMEISCEIEIEVGDMYGYVAGDKEDFYVLKALYEKQNQAHASTPSK